jgi:hypothetical protein
MLLLGVSSLMEAPARARPTPRPVPTTTQTLQPLQRSCPTCGETRWAASHHSRTRTTLEAGLALTLQMRRGLNRGCPPFRPPSRPALAGRRALPKPALGLAVSARMGPWRDAAHRRIPAIQQAVRACRVAWAPRTVPDLLAREDAWGALSRQAPPRRPRLTQARGRVLFARAGLPPAVGHAGLWGWRDGRAGEVRRARRFLAAPPAALAFLVQAVPQALRGPLVGGSSAGPPSSRPAVAPALPGVPPPWWQGPARREAAQPLSEAARHAKTSLPQRGRGGQPLARPGAGRPDHEAAVVRG